MNTVHELLKKLSEGKLTAQEKATLFEWIQTNQQEWGLSLYDEYRQFLASNQSLLSDEKSAEILHRIHNKLQRQAPPGESSQEEPLETRSRVAVWFERRKLYLGIAASLTILIAFFFLTNSNPTETPDRTATASQEKSTHGELVTVTNTTGQTLPVPLPDGSSVLLYPSSEVVFPASFHSKREITLSGKAFFEIVKQPEKPFFVYANEMVTEVLGTSFVIDAFEEHNQFSISVRSGRVAVSSRAENKVDKQSEISLQANEKVLFNRDSKRFMPKKIPAFDSSDQTFPKLPETYRFRNTPVNEIFSILEHDYLIDIEVEQELLSDCALTTTLKDKPLFEKLRIICEGIGPGTHFTMENGKVLINTLGCNH